MTLLFTLLILSFFGYHYTFFSYCAYIFNVNKYPKIASVVCGAFNLSCWIIYIFYWSSNYEAAVLLLYALAVFVQTRIVFKATLRQMLFITVTFTINLFAKRLAVLATMALLKHTTIAYVLSDIELSAIVAIACFTISISTIGFARKMIPRNSLDTILSDNKNLAFLTIAYSILFGTLFAFCLAMEADGGNILLIHYIVLGTIVISAFAVFIIFAYNLAELRIQTETYKRLSQKNNEDLKHLEDLEKAAIKDALTYLYTRDYADELIQKMIDEDCLFFVAFIDLDGLKKVNDIHGHEEGDFYIKTVADILRDYFKDDAVCRYGGDEIVIVGRCNAEDTATRKLIQSCKVVASIPKLYNKDYKTSISYGVAFKHANEIITTSELIAIADTRMYELKKQNNKHRKAVSVK